MNLLIIFFLLLSNLLLAMEKKWIVVTTIQYPTPQLRQLAKIPGWQLLVVGDKKTPCDWELENCIYLSPQKQLNLGYEIAGLLPWNHYSRKNIGYLYAIEHGAELIYDTDDDNEPLSELTPSSLKACENVICLTTDHHCLNVYSYFGHPEIWPRGYPLEKISSKNSFSANYYSNVQIGVEQGLVNKDPDVDAIFRLIKNEEIYFDPKPLCCLPKGTFCPFNSQNTFFFEKAFFALYLPSFVNMRVSDIWRGYISQRLLWETGQVIGFSGPTALQTRNMHILIKDFSDEMDLYLKAGNLIEALILWKNPFIENLPLSVIDLFQKLIEKDFLKQNELAVIQAWLRDFEKVKNKRL